MNNVPKEDENAKPHTSKMDIALYSVLGVLGGLALIIGIAVLVTRWRNHRALKAAALKVPAPVAAAVLKPPPVVLPAKP